MNNTLILNIISPSTTQTLQAQATTDEGGLFGELMGSISSKFSDTAKETNDSNSKANVTLSEKEINELELNLSAFLSLIISFSEKIDLDITNFGDSSIDPAEISNFLAALDKLTSLSSLEISSKSLNEALSLLNDLKSSLSSEIGEISDQKISLISIKSSFDSIDLNNAIQNLNNTLLMKQRNGIGAELSVENTNLILEKTALSDISGQSLNNIKGQHFNNISEFLAQADEINNRLKELLSTLTVNQKSVSTQPKSNKVDTTLISTYSSLNLNEPKLINNDIKNNLANSVLLTHINEQLSWVNREETNDSIPEITNLDLEQPLFADNKSVSDVSNTDKASLSPARTFQGSINIPFASEAWQNAFNKQMLMFIKNGVQNAELRLHPQELGVINIQLSLDDNLVKLQLFSANPQVRSSMENTLNNLKTAFDAQGYHLDESFIGNENQHNSNFSEDNNSFERLNSPKKQGSEIDDSNIANNTDIQTKPTPSSRSVGIDNFI
ncbi:flagellar hook-length control protein FliK [Thorsellia anophelis]|uniref:Flagellar hook-length control protein FliK n=1 Tax=Thorsellia anophelis DSM 18579 TaxID=1123402 RepID=A0A1H9ZUL5_9GAMM|nr:flagellar hook-length control protein FliK [Thorsellia anophelis]SES84970.1 Flagellar hook-length control protein FliK [Thorsellia anophelis DSM 18579]